VTSISVKTLATHLCHDVVDEVGIRHGIAFIVTSFRYPDGDSVNLYVDRRDGESWVTDLGTTHTKFALEGMRITEARQRVIDVVCRSYGVRQSELSLAARLDPASPSVGCLGLCEAITRISTLHYGIVSNERSDIHGAIESILKARVGHARKWTQDWTDPALDERQAFPVDFRMNGTGKPRHLFGVASRYKAALVSAVSHFFRAHDKYVPTMCVIDPAAKLGRHHIDRVQLAADEIVFGVDEDRIAEFALSRE
jgi:hypothetical protein